MIFPTKTMITIGALVLSTALQAKEVVAHIDEKYLAVISNEVCHTGSSKDVVLYQAYIREKATLKNVDEGCWYPQGEVIFLLFPPTENEEGYGMGINASKFFVPITL